MKSFLIFSVVALIAREVVGHGMMLDPPGRASMWRFDIAGSVPDYNDDQNNCGGLGVYVANGLQCGVCGDAFTDPHPQDNENTGKFGVGKVVKTYQSGSVIETEIKLTTNHKGTFTYSLCVLPNPNAPEPGESCFQPLNLEDGSSVYTIQDQTEGAKINIKNRVQLPAGVTCERCVLRWQYRAGNNWGDCGDGTSGLGCGNQETFRSCADVTIQ